MGLLYRTKYSLVYNLIVYYHYRIVYNKETVTGEDILESACLLTYKFPSVTTWAFPHRCSHRMTGNSAPLILGEIGNINSPINSSSAPCFQKIRLENVFSTFHHQEIPRREIVFVACLRDLS